MDHLRTLQQMDGPLAAFAEQLPPLLAQFYNKPHGDLAKWQQALDALPSFACHTIDNDQGLRLHGTFDSPIPTALTSPLAATLMELHPWRKGPYHINDLHLDTEWRSDWKWQRLVPYVGNLRNKRVLDVGCGNGYHSWVMALAGAKQVIGIDPMLLFNMQFRCIHHFAQQHPLAHKLDVLPLGIDEMPTDLAAFDTVFSMGVLYHRKDPLEHIRKLASLLNRGGELVLETLVVERAHLSPEQDEVLVPEKRYAKMRNVWAIPTTQRLMLWMEQAGLRECRLVDVANTSCHEQRSTAWMTFHSLRDFLAEQDISKTVEGLPAPRRAMIIGRV